jgi:hypothetical protein
MADRNTSEDPLATVQEKTFAELIAQIEPYAGRSKKSEGSVSHFSMGLPLIIRSEAGERRTA